MDFTNYKNYTKGKFNPTLSKTESTELSPRLQKKCLHHFSQIPARLLLSHMGPYLKQDIEKLERKTNVFFHGRNVRGRNVHWPKCPWPKCPWPKCPLAEMSVAEMSVAEMSWPKHPWPKCPWPKCPSTVQRQAARFITGDYKTREEGCVTRMLETLELSSLEQRRRLVFIIKVVEGLVPAIPPDAGNLRNLKDRSNLRNTQIISLKTYLTGTL